MFKKKPEPIQSISQVVNLLAASVVTLIGIRFLATDLLAPILLAFFISALLLPLVNFFKKRGASPRISLVMTVLLLVTGVFIFIGIFWQAIGQLQSILLTYSGNIDQITTEVANSLNLKVNDATLQTISNNFSSIIALARSVLGQLGNITVYFFMVPLLVIFLVSSKDTISAQLHHVLGDESSALHKISRVIHSVSLYLISRTKVNLITGILMGCFLFLLGIEGWFTWGFLAFLLGYIPYIGLIIATAPPVLIGFLSGGIWLAVVVGAGFAMLNLFTENFLEPKITGETLRLSPSAVLISFLFWTWLLGPTGTILSVPMTVFAKIVLADFQETRWIAAVMEGKYEDIPTLQETKKKTWWGAIKSLISSKKS